jgi:hypothetical protein
MRFVDEQQQAVETGREGKLIGLSASELVSRLCDLERIKAERADQRVQKGEKGGAAG